MANRKSTHRGHCQACGRLQAVNPEMNLLAKHGYTVEWGFFNGVCMGADNLPIENDHALTKRVQTSLEEQAVGYDRTIAELKAGKDHPSTVRTGRCMFDKIARKHVVEVIDWEKANEYQRQCEVELVVSELGHRARQTRSHIAFLDGLVESYHGKPLTPVKKEVEKVVEEFYNTRQWVDRQKELRAQGVKFRSRRANNWGPGGKIWIEEKGA